MGPRGRVMCYCTCCRVRFVHVRCGSLPQDAFFDVGQFMLSSQTCHILVSLSRMRPDQQSFMCPTCDDLRHGRNWQRRRRLESGGRGSHCLTQKIRQDLFHVDLSSSVLILVMFRFEFPRLLGTGQHNSHATCFLH